MIPWTGDSEGEEQTGSADECLTNFISSDDPVECQALLEKLLCHYAAPVIRRVVSHRLRQWGAGADCDDVTSEVQAELIERLVELKDGQERQSIQKFESYVGICARHACNENFRRRFPQRRRLKTRLRYLLGKDGEFALWERADGIWLSGLAEWRGKSGEVGSLARVESSLQDLTTSTHPSDLLRSIFEHVGDPVLFEDLVNCAGKLWGITDRIELLDPRHPGAFQDPGQALDTRRWVERVWREIGELPRNQRVALLLSLRDHTGSAAAPLLPALGLASIRQIAAVLEIEVDEFAGLWRRLPAGDNEIAALLGTTRQQVINLRKSARERLSRRMNARQER